MAYGSAATNLFAAEAASYNALIEDYKTSNYIRMIIHNKTIITEIQHSNGITFIYHSMHQSLYQTYHAPTFIKTKYILLYGRYTYDHIRIKIGAKALNLCAY